MLRTFGARLGHGVNGAERGLNPRQELRLI
jgi:hypothetical protein